MPHHLDVVMKQLIDLAEARVMAMVMGADYFGSNMMCVRLLKGCELTETKTSVDRISDCTG